MLKKRTLLVTGGAGFIGSCFVAQSIARGDNVVLLDALTYAGHRENVENLKGEGKLHFVKGSICDGALVLSLLKEHKVEAVINFAAESHVDNSISSPGIFIETNIIGTQRMLEASLQHYRELDHQAKQHFRYIQISTDEVYGSLGETGFFTEESQYQPNSPYSASKAAGDHLVRAWHHTYDFPGITTNCSNNYGPRQFPEKLIPHMITRALQGASLPVYGDGKNIRDWIHVEDHCNGVYLALNRGRAGETYCFGGNAEKTNIELVTTLCRTLDSLRSSSGKYENLIKFVADRPGHDRRYAIDDTKAVNELGFSRKYTFETGLRSTIEWYLENTRWCEAVTQKAA